MGDRFYLTLNCAYCGKENDDISYAPTCCFYDFDCKDCGGINFIKADFSVKKAEEVSEEDIVGAFEMATTASHKQQAIQREATHYLKILKKRIRENARKSNE